GPQNTMDKKIKILRPLFPIIQNRYDQIEYVDLRFPENVVIKYNSAKVGQKVTGNTGTGWEGL
ncbi:MAG: hypothetical protein WC838_05490, partial [Candidatus Margulisiibacteriota bacterium]